MMKITGLSHLFKWETLHNWWLTKYFFAPLYISMTDPNWVSHGSLLIFCSRQMVSNMFGTSNRNKITVLYRNTHNRENREDPGNSQP